MSGENRGRVPNILEVFGMRDKTEWTHGMLLVEDHIPLAGKVCIDCGANVGKWARPLAEIFDKVVLIEPDERAFSRLVKQRDEESRLPANSEIHHAAVGREPGNAEFSIMPQMMHSHLGASPKAKNIVFVKIVNLNQYADENVDFVKVDVEGHEIEVLAGGLELFQKQKPIIIVETHNTMQKVRDFVADNMPDYTIHEYGEPPRCQFALVSKN